MVLAQNFERPVNGRIAVMNEIVEPLLPCRHFNMRRAQTLVFQTKARRTSCKAGQIASHGLYRRRGFGRNPQRQEGSMALAGEMALGVEMTLGGEMALRVEMAFRMNIGRAKCAACRQTKGWR